MVVSGNWAAWGQWYWTFFICIQWQLKDREAQTHLVPVSNPTPAAFHGALSLVLDRSVMSFCPIRQELKPTIKNTNI